jgi:hypothetical protein
MQPWDLIEPAICSIMNDRKRGRVPLEFFNENDRQVLAIGGEKFEAQTIIDVNPMGICARDARYRGPADDQFLQKSLRASKLGKRVDEMGMEKII